MEKPVQTFLVAGLGFGDEGKGTIVDYLTRLHGAKLVVRYNGGPQAAHNVVTPEGIHHTFAQYGSGTLAGANTFLSRYMLVEPFALVNETNALARLGIDGRERLTIDSRAYVITPYHWIANQLRELQRGSSRHGSCGFGIGELRSDQLASRKLFETYGIDDLITVGDLLRPDVVTKKLYTIQSRKLKEFPNSLRLLREDPDGIASFYFNFAQRFQITYDKDWLQTLVANHTTIFEGAQGVLIDERHGFAPHTTWTDCTFGNAEELLRGTREQVKCIGVLRAFATRHGPGLFPSEDSSLEARFQDIHNPAGRWQGPMRYGHFDPVMSRYALVCIGGVDSLAITHLDSVRDVFSWVGHYENGSITSFKNPVFKKVCGFKMSDIVRIIENLLWLPVEYMSYGPTFNEKYTVGTQNSPANPLYGR